MVTPFDSRFPAPPSIPSRGPRRDRRGDVPPAAHAAHRSHRTGRDRHHVRFEGITFVDSSGLGVLVGAYKRLRDGDQGTIRIVDAQSSVRKVFEITGLESALLTD